MSDKYKSRLERRKAQETSKRKKQGNKTNKPKRSRWKKVLLSLVIAGLLFMTAGVVTAAVMISSAPALDPDQLVFSQAAEIYDQNDEQVTRLESSENRDLIDIDNVPEHVKSAFVAVEDVRFYDHFGIDIRRLFGALAANLTEGFGAEGASTITQQVVKNAFLSQDKTITRKVQEQYLAIRLEQKYSKNQILEMYLNLIYFNKGAYGVGEAASVYFNKDDASALTIEDAALLAAIPRRPSYYDPTINPEASQKRRDTIITLMSEHGFISAEDAEQAKSVAVEDQIDYNPPDEKVVYDSFITQVQQELEEVDGITTSDLYSAGLKIYTTLDTSAQDFAEQVIQMNDYINYYPESEDFQVGFTLLDTETGAIKAMVGNRQSQDIARGMNYAARSAASPGSSIKPVLDYGPAIEYNKWSTYHQIEDAPHTYSNGTPIRNYTGTYSGNVSMREALVRSLNIPAVKALQETGRDRAGDFARGLGLPIEEVYEAYALGGLTNGVASLDMAGAFAAFGNGGTYNKPYTVRKVEFPDGRVMDFEPKSHKAMEDYTAYMITDMLKDVVTDPRGTGRAVNIPGLPLAGKTGTTNFTEEEHRKFNIPPGGDPDVWFTGYTPKYTASVWSGFSGDRGKNYLINNQSNISKEVFRLIMSHVSEGVDTPDFVKPDSVVEIALERGTGKRASSYTPASEIIRELFVKGTGPETVSTEYTPSEEETSSEITGLQGNYDKEGDAIQLSWNYEGEEAAEVTFQIEHKVADGSYETLGTQAGMAFTLSAPEKGTTHHFRVTVRGGEESATAETQVNVPGQDEDEDDEEEDTDEDTDEDEIDDDNNPGENPSPGNGGGNNENGQNPSPGNGQDNGGSDNNGNNNGNNGSNGDGNNNNNGNGNAPPNGPDRDNEGNVSQNNVDESEND